MSNLTRNVKADHLKVLMVFTPVTVTPELHLCHGVHCIVHVRTCFLEVGLFGLNFVSALVGQWSKVFVRLCGFLFHPGESALAVLVAMSKFFFHVFLGFASLLFVMVRSTGSW